MDIRQVLGEAPQEQETAGTSGRMRLPDDKGVLLKGLTQVADMGTDFLKAFNKSEADAAKASAFAQAVDVSLGSAMEVPPELTAEIQATGSKLANMEAQGLSPARIAQRRSAALRKMIRENPTQAETIVSAFNKTETMVNDLQTIEKEQMDEAMANRKYGVEEGRKLLVNYGIDVTGMTDEGVIQAMQPLMQHTQKLKLVKDELDMLNNNTELTKLQRINRLDTVATETLDTYLVGATSEVQKILSDPTMNLDQKAGMVADKLSQREVQLRKLFQDMPDAMFQQKFGAFFAYKDLALKRSQGKFDGVELQTINNQLKTIQATSQLELYRLNPSLPMQEATFQTVGNAMKMLPAFDQQKIGNQFVTKLVQDTINLNKSPNARVMNGTEVKTPQGAVIVTAEQGIQAVESYTQGFGRAGDTDITPEDKKLVAAQLTTLANEYTQNNNPKAINALIRSYANPQVTLRLDNEERLTKDLRQTTEPLVREYTEKTFAAVATRLESNSNRYTVTYDKEGLPVLEPVSAFQGSNSQLKAEEALLRDAIKAHTHVFRGNKDYAATVKEMAKQ